MQVRREYVLVLAPRLPLAAASWAVLIWQAGMMAGMGLTMGLGIGVFLAVWVVMMVARVQRERGSFGRACVLPWIFVGAYLLVWTLFGGLSYLGANAASELACTVPWLMRNATRIGGGLLVLAGLYQFMPIKRVCLAKCGRPQQFIRDEWRDGRAGALRMGLSHGLSCLGANWLLCVLLFPLGLMNLAAMAVLTVLICAEKCFPQAERIAWGAGLALILYGTLVIVVPAALPLNGAGM